MWEIHGHEIFMVFEEPGHGNFYPVSSKIPSCIVPLHHLAHYLESENRLISRVNKRSQIEFLILTQRYCEREISHVPFL